MPNPEQISGSSNERPADYLSVIERIVERPPNSGKFETKSGSRKVSFDGDVDILRRVIKLTQNVGQESKDK